VNNLFDMAGGTTLQVPKLALHWLLYGVWAACLAMFVWLFLAVEGRAFAAEERKTARCA